MSLGQFLNPAQTTPKGRIKTELEETRERILRYIMIFVAAASILAYLFLGISTLIQGNVFPFFVYSIVTVIVVNVAISKQIPYNVQAGILILAIYGAGVYSFFTAGLIGDGKLYMLGFTVVTGVLLGLIPSIVALGISVVTTAVFGFGMVRGFIVVPEQNWMATSTNGLGWLVATIFVAVICGIAAIGLTFMIASLESSLKKEKRTIDEITKQKQELEKTVRNAVNDVERRISQIKTAAEISRSISNQLDFRSLLMEVAEQLQLQFNLYYVGVFIVDENQFAVLRYGTGEAGQKMMAESHRLQVGGSSMVGWCIANKKSRIALDVGKDAVRFNNPFLPDTHSELALPIISRGEAVGALTVQSKQSNVFDDNDIRILQGVADSLAVSIENTKLMDRMQQNVEEIRSLNRTYLLQGWSDAVAVNGAINYSYENELRSNVTANNQIQLPLTLRDETIGQITLDVEQKNLSPEELEFIEAISVQTALALENARLIDETQRKAMQEATVNRMSAEFSRGLNIDEIISSAMKEIKHLPSVSEVSIFLGTPGLAGSPDNNGHNLEGAV